MVFRLVVRRSVVGQLVTVEVGIGECCRSAKGRRGLPPILRARSDLAASLEIGENPLETLRRQVFVIILVDLSHWCVDASAEALDLRPGKKSVRGDLVRLTDQSAARILDRVSASEPARRRAADLHVVAADRRQIEHGVEGCDLIDPDIGHSEHAGDVAERGLWQPAAHLLLRPPQNREHGGSLAAFGIFLDLSPGPFKVFRRKGETLRLLGGEAADAH